MRFTNDPPVNFPNQIVPIFTKLGCNTGGCHGKSSGQNGFRLSLLGFEPTEDYEHLVKEGRGRRLFPAAPERSLMLLKATGTDPARRRAADGSRFAAVPIDSAAGSKHGMPYGKPDDPTVARIEVVPPIRTLSPGGKQQLICLAHYTDGTVEDVTANAKFEPNDTEMAEVSPIGIGDRARSAGRGGGDGPIPRPSGRVSRRACRWAHRSMTFRRREEFHRRVGVQAAEDAGDSAFGRVRRRHVPAPHDDRSLPAGCRRSRKPQQFAGRNRSGQAGQMDRHAAGQRRHADYFATKWSCRSCATSG